MLPLELAIAFFASIGVYTLLDCLLTVLTGDTNTNKNK